MKHFLSQMIKVPMLLLFILMSCIFGLSALGSKAEVNQFAIITALGIDRVSEEEEKYEVSYLSFIPIAQQGFAERYKVVSAKGRSVAEAMDFAGIQLGRQVGLTHLKMVVLNDKLFDEDISIYLDYLIRNKDFSSSVKLIATDKSAQEFLKASQKLDSDSSVKVSELISFNKDYIFATDTTLEKFFKGTLGPTRSAFVDFLTTETAQDSQSMSQSGGGGSGDSSGGGAGQESQDAGEIKNEGNAYIFKDGKAKALLNGRDMQKINMLKGDYKMGTLEIRNVNDKNFTNADLAFEIFDNRTKYNVAYENGIPVVSLDVKLTLKLSEVKNEGEMLNENIELFIVSDEVERQLKNEVRTLVKGGLAIMRENQADLVDFYTFLHNRNIKKFNDFLDGLEDKDDYLNHIVFKTSVSISAR